MSVNEAEETFKRLVLLPGVQGKMANSNFDHFSRQLVLSLQSSKRNCGHERRRHSNKNYIYAKQNRSLREFDSWPVEQDQVGDQRNGPSQ